MRIELIIWGQKSQVLSVKLQRRSFTTYYEGTLVKNLLLYPLSYRANNLDNWGLLVIIFPIILDSTSISRRTIFSIFLDLLRIVCSFYPRQFSFAPNYQSENASFFYNLCSYKVGLMSSAGELNSYCNIENVESSPLDEPTSQDTLL